jgi:hypothetical protein
MDQQTLAAFEDNLKTLLRITKRVSPEKENLTPDEVEFFPHLAAEVQGFTTRSTEIHTKYFGPDEPGWLALRLVSDYQFFFLLDSTGPPFSSLEYIKRTKRVVLERTPDSIIEYPQRIGRDKFYSWLSVATLFLFTALTGLLFCGSNQEQGCSDAEPRKSTTISSPFNDDAIDGMTISVAKFTLIFIFSPRLYALV